MMNTDWSETVALNGPLNIGTFRVMTVEGGFVVGDPTNRPVSIWGAPTRVYTDRSMAQAVVDAANRSYQDQTPCSHGEDI